MTNSLLNGTQWNWRQGLKPMPYLTAKEDIETFKSQELCMRVQSLENAINIIAELKKNGIKADMKRTHSRYDIFPPDTLIVYASLSETLEKKEEEENINKLKDYILKNGGTVYDPEIKKSVITHFITNIFGRR